MNLYNENFDLKEKKCNNLANFSFKKYNMNLLRLSIAFIYFKISIIYHNYQKNWLYIF